MAQRADKSGKVRLVAMMAPAELEEIREWARAQGRSASSAATMALTEKARAWKRGTRRPRAAEGGGERVEKLKG